MPMTPAERQRKYREKLKTNNPEKYAELKRKVSENALNYYKNKKNKYTPEQKEEQRRKWKEDREKSKTKMPSTSQENSVVEEAQKMPSTSQKNSVVQEAQKMRNIQRRIEYKLKVENIELRNKVSNLSKRFKSLQKKCLRQQKKFKEMNEILENIMIRLNTLEDSRIPDVTEDTIRQNIDEYTPRKKVEEFINENVPNIETPKKENIKDKLLQLNVLTETLKQEMKNSNNSEKNTFKKILNNNLVKKYKQKSKFTISLGLKSNLKQKRRVHIRKSVQLRNKIEEFYNRDDVTRATAGKKECKTHKKVTRQIRYQLDKLKILHRKFISEVGTISFSTFKKHRPFYVLPPKIKDCETCACVKHSNMQFMIDELKSQGLLQQESINDITSNFVCDFQSKECMYGECGICADRKLDSNGKDETEKVKWSEWTMKEHEYGQGEKAKKIKRMMKITNEGTLQDLLNIFNEEMKKFKIHVFNFYHQYNKYKECRDNLKDNEAIIHIDFSENFTCKYHKEVQATHFIKEQITLHTGVLYLKNEKPISFCSISPNNEHSPEAIWAHLDPILKYVKSDYPNVSILHFFSDGPTTQYRQKKKFYLFSKNIYDYGFKQATWSFFEAAHGKGAADGIGGAIKRQLDTKIAHGHDVPDAISAFNVLNASESAIKVFFIPTESIKPLDLNLVPINGTMKIHQLMTVGILKVRYRNLSCFCNDLNGLCGCYSPMNHEFKNVQETGKTQTNKSKKRKTSEKENEKYSVKTKKTRKSRKLSTSSEEDSMDIEYADSDVTCYMEDSSQDILDIDMELDENKDIPKIPEEANTSEGILDIDMDLDENMDISKIAEEAITSEGILDIDMDLDENMDISKIAEEAITSEGILDIDIKLDENKDIPKIPEEATTSEGILDIDMEFEENKDIPKIPEEATTSEGILNIDMVLDVNKDIPKIPEEAAHFVLDEKTGILINCNKKITILSNKILMKPENSKKSNNKEMNKRSDKITHDKNKVEKHGNIADQDEFVGNINKSGEGCIKVEEDINEPQKDANKVEYGKEDESKGKKDRIKTDNNENKVNEDRKRAKENTNIAEDDKIKSDEGCNNAGEDINKAKEDKNNAGDGKEDGSKGKKDRNETNNNEIEVNEDINRAKENTNISEDDKIKSDEGCNKAEEDINKAKEDKNNAEDGKEDESKGKKDRNETVNNENEDQSRAQKNTNIAENVETKSDEGCKKAEEDIIKAKEDKNKVEDGKEDGSKGKKDRNKINTNENKVNEDDENSIPNLMCRVIKINDTVLVRYYQKKTWKYYVGFIINLELKDGEQYYKIKFLKTVKDPLRYVKFIIPKKRDIDIVPEVSIVKQINITQEKDSNEYNLCDESDTVYFV